MIELLMCPDCNGFGYWYEDTPSGEVDLKYCLTCNGSGTIEVEDGAQEERGE